MFTPDFVIDKLGGTKAVADALSLDASTVSCWRSSRKGRGSIPSSRWLPLARLAADKGVPEITLESLAELAAGEPAEEVKA
jgi:hypothetical protein